MARTKQQTDDTIVSSLKTLTKSSVWDVQENDVFRMLESGLKDADIRENVRHYVDIIRNAFEIVEVKEDTAPVKKAYEKKGYKVGSLKFDDQKKTIWALKKKPILRVTDLSYENIRHISAAKLLEVLERNFGGGWDSLSQSIQDIIVSGFDISTTTLPKDRLHKKGGMYEKKVDDGFEVLEIPKGNWVEAIFAKLKPEPEKPKKKDADDEDIDNEDMDDEDFEVQDDYKNHDEEEQELDDPDDDQITEDNYSTMMNHDYSPSILARARGIHRGIGHGVLLLHSDDEGRRRYAPYERDCTLCAQRCHGISRTAVQGGIHRIRRTLRPLCLHGLWTARTESLGALCFPHRRFLLRPGRILRYEDCHLCLCPYCQCCP